MKPNRCAGMPILVPIVVSAQQSGSQKLNAQGGAISTKQADIKQTDNIISLDQSIVGLNSQVAPQSTSRCILISLDAKRRLYQSVWQPWILLEKATIALNVSVLGNRSNFDTVPILARCTPRQISAQEAAIGLQLDTQSKAISFRLQPFGSSIVSSIHATAGQRSMRVFKRMPHRTLFMIWQQLHMDWAGSLQSVCMKVSSMKI